MNIISYGWIVTVIPPITLTSYWFCMETNCLFSKVNKSLTHTYTYTLTHSQTHTHSHTHTHSLNIVSSRVWWRLHLFFLPLLFFSPNRTPNIDDCPSVSRWQSSGSDAPVEQSTHTHTHTHTFTHTKFSVCVSSIVLSFIISAAVINQPSVSCSLSIAPSVHSVCVCVNV